MAKTKQEICTRVAEELGITPVSQATPGGQFALIERIFDDVFEELSALGVIAWTPDETPNECARALAVYVAQEAAQAVPTTSEVLDRFERLGQKPYRDLIRVAGTRWTVANPTTVDRF